MSNSIKRVVTAVILGVVLLYSLWVRGAFLRVMLVLMTGLSLAEMYRAMVLGGKKPAWQAGVLFAALAMPLYLRFGADALLPLLALCCMVGFALVLYRGKPDYDAAVATVLPLIYPGLFVTLLFPMQDFTPPAMGILALALSFIAAFCGDIAAYEIGTVFGRRKLIPEVSPNKTVEGAVASLAGSILGAIVLGALSRLLPGMTAPPPLWHMAILGAVVGVIAQYGDLTASLIKRYMGVKDYGQIFPGHGGLLDRIDSALFSTAVVYAYFTWVVLA